MAANGNKKHGTTKKKPAQQRYTAERRWESNKRRRIATDKAHKARAAARRAARIAARRTVRKPQQVAA